MDRRTLLKAGLGLTVAGTADTEAQENPAAARPKAGDLLVKVSDSSATPLKPEDISQDARQIFAWAMDPETKTVRNGSRLNRIVLVRLNPDVLTAETKSRAVSGVVAYTAVCTHNGCEVAEWIATEHALVCPCHTSKFDAADGAKVTDGPAPRSLPALPLKVSDGNLVVAKPFTSKISFEQG